MTPDPSSDFRQLPTARRVLGRAFDLDLRASGDLRRASLFMAAQFLLVVGPIALVLAVLFVRLPELLDLIDPGAIDPTTAPDLPLPDEAFVGQVGIGLVIATLGWVAITIESQIVAIAVLAGRHVDRPVSLREAVARSRQTFWRVVRAAFIVGIPAAIAGATVGATFAGTLEPDSEALALVSLAVGVVVAIPFAYVPSAIVLGDVGAREAISRGFRLVQARWHLAAVVAVFTAAAQYLQLFAIGAGGDILVRVGTALELGFDRGDAVAVLTYGLILAAIVAFGTLLFTTIAIAVAPQVVAFLALTHVHVGLDRAREAAAVGPGSGLATEPSVTHPGDDAPPDSARSGWDHEPVPTRVRLVSLPMIAGGILSIAVAVAAFAGVSRLG